MANEDSGDHAEMPTPTETDESRRGDSQTLPLQIGHDLRRLDELRGQIHGELAALRRRTDADEWASATKLFERAATNEWPLAYWAVTSDAHSWQIENAESDGDPYLAASADPLDIRHLVFENGWIYVHREGFVQAEETVAAIQSVQDTQAETADRIDSKKAEVFTADSRLQYATDRRGQEMESFWHFDPADFAGAPLDVVAFRAGWDAHHEASQPNQF